jgi:hypothetical protein
MSDPNDHAPERPLLMQRLLVGGALSLIVGSAASLLVAALWSAQVPFIFSGDGAVWIAAPRTVAPETLLVADGHAQRTTFSYTFEIDAVPAIAVARARSLGVLELDVNGRVYALASQPDACIKQTCTAEVAAALTVGTNHILARVERTDGVALLRLAIDGGGWKITTNESWRVVSGAPAGTVSAVVADDTRPYAQAASGPTSLEALVDNLAIVVALFVVGAVGFGVARRRTSAALVASLPLVAIVIATTFWVFLYVGKSTQIPLQVGHDARPHLHYVHTVASRGRLPLADEGFSTYHPPLYYVTSAALLRLFRPERGGDWERRLLKLVPAAAGLGMVWLTLALVARLFPGDALMASSP